MFDSSFIPLLVSISYSKRARKQAFYSLGKFILAFALLPKHFTLLTDPILISCQAACVNSFRAIWQPAKIRVLSWFAQKSTGFARTEPMEDLWFPPHKILAKVEEKFATFKLPPRISKYYPPPIPPKYKNKIFTPRVLENGISNTLRFFDPIINPQPIYSAQPNCWNQPDNSSHGPGKRPVKDLAG